LQPHYVYFYTLQFQYVHHLLLLIMELLTAHWEMMAKPILETLVPSHVMMALKELVVAGEHVMMIKFGLALFLFVQFKVLTNFDFQWNSNQYSLK